MIKTWDDITISIWQELEAIEADNAITRFLNQISIITDTDIDEIRSMPIIKFNKLRDDLKFMNEPPNKDVVVKFEIDGVKYGIIPQMDFMSAGEWIDAENWKDKVDENIHLYSALIYRPITKETATHHEIEPHTSSGFIERANLFKERLPITTVYGAVLFFSAFVMSVTKVLADYLMEEHQENLTKISMTKATQTHTKKQND